MEQIQILGLASLTAGIVKIAILLSPQAQNKFTSAFALVCISMIFQNAFEFLATISYYKNPALINFLLHSQVLSIISLIFCLFVFTLTVIQSKHARELASIFALWGLVCTYLLLNGHLVLGYEQASYSIVPAPTKLHPLFNAYAFTTFASMLFILSRSSLKANGEIRTKSLQVLIAIIPICLVGFTVQLLKLLGFNASAAIYMSIATTFFIAIMMLYKSDRITIFKIKWTVIWRLAASMRDVKLGKWVELVEELMVKEAMHISDNNQTEAAKLIKSNQTTVGRKFKKYESESTGELKCITSPLQGKH